VNPAKLEPARRDAVCMQCHLEGNVAIEQPGRRLSDFRAGDDLADFVHYYLQVGDEVHRLRALGQSEALVLSICKQKAGDAMSCTSCHDPHSSPRPEERVAFYRGKCLACHGNAFGAKHHAAQQDCTSCHMPRISSVDVAHTQATDHRILRLPAMPLENVQGTASAELVRFPPVSGGGPEKPDTRDLALAWESLAQSGDRAATPEAERFLRQGVTERPDDPALLTGLAFFELRRGEVPNARELYERALKGDPTLSDAATNLGVIEARDGHLDRAVQLWRDVFARAPGRSGVGMNIARIYCGAGRVDQARTYVGRVLEFNPDLPEAKVLMKSLASDSPKCDAR
jgi:predicted CXXCH cytochrome family protein